MLMIVGLDAPTAGQVTVAGRSYGRVRFPLRQVGTLLDAGAVHPGRTARDHLAWLAASNEIPRDRVDEVLAIVGLTGLTVYELATQRASLEDASREHGEFRAATLRPRAEPA